MILFFITSFLLIVVSSENNAPIVQTPLGLIEGNIEKSSNGRNFYSFRGIPFAKPPVGKYRFEPSVPNKPWSGIWKANNSYVCLQYNHFNCPGRDKVEGEEDCLYLNVFTPILKKNANLDVVVYIHGGAFMFNSGNVQGPKKLMDKDVVQVNINYRLGPFGFLSTEDDLVPGNNGIKDQILAMKWVKDNIELFGGNSDSITIFGMSAGGASVELHYLIPESKGLFHKGVSQSGVSLNPWVIMENPLEQANKLGAAVGCSTKNTEKLVKCLKKRPGRQIVSAISHFQPWLYNPFSPFGVVVDSWSKNPLLRDHPYNLLKNKQVYDVPWISSFTSEEGLYPASEFYPEEYLQELDSKWNDIIPHILHYNFTINHNELDKISSQIKTYYLKDKKVSKTTYSKLVKLIGDRLFYFDIEKGVKLHSAAVKSDVFSYKFSHRGAYSASDFISGSRDNLGASHADDTAYIFHTFDTNSTPEDRAVSDFLMDTCTAFMKTGKPMSKIQWHPVSKNLADPLNVLHIENSNSIKMETLQDISNQQFWNLLPFAENEKLLAKENKDEL